MHSFTTSSSRARLHLLAEYCIYTYIIILISNLIKYKCTNKSVWINSFFRTKDAMKLEHPLEKIACWPFYLHQLIGVLEFSSLWIITCMLVNVFCENCQNYFIRPPYEICDLTFMYLCLFIFIYFCLYIWNKFYTLHTATLLHPFYNTNE